ncbi:hypothetical protein BU16DRAFT_541688 [Lophium mytilinum]|uniref:Uncharacterized protein n=1 Tax=Lophium mytilinum TaxID=390894 RepID=A0A6A6QPS2_9PEZI|nr:hypothetical protein BU16DRAFT_541688 [Lophium mytilinum]
MRTIVSLAPAGVKVVYALVEGLEGEGAYLVRERVAFLSILTNLVLLYKYFFNRYYTYLKRARIYISSTTVTLFFNARNSKVNYTISSIFYYNFIEEIKSISKEIVLSFIVKGLNIRKLGLHFLKSLLSSICPAKKRPRRNTVKEEKEKKEKELVETAKAEREKKEKEKKEKELAEKELAEKALAEKALVEIVKVEKERKKKEIKKKEIKKRELVDIAIAEKAKK